jgi:hypothetical protein
MEDYHLNNIAKVRIFLVPNHIGEINIFNSSKNGHVFSKTKVTLLKT